MKRPLALVLVCAVGLTGCSSQPDQADLEAGALAAAHVYVDAIAARDLQAVNAMTDPAAFKDFPPRDTVDARAALSQAQEPISDAWLNLANVTSSADYGGVAYVIAVSYRVADRTGGDEMTIEIDAGEDPGDIRNWRVTEPLLAQGAASSDIGSASLSGVALSFDPMTDVSVVGYPGEYRLEATSKSGVAPIPVVIGAADAGTWEEPKATLGDTE